MGRDLDKERFTEAEYVRFGERLEEQLGTLRELLDTPGFGQGPATVGAELELFLIDEEGRPLPRNSQVKDALDDHRVVLELGRYNIEVNLTPIPLAGSPFAKLGAEVQETLTKVDGIVERGGAVPIGILPTLDTEDFTLGAMSDQNRYRAMSRGIRRLRLEPFLVKIDDLELSVEDVILESANTSWQVHIRTPPERFARLFNAAQLAVGPVLAVCGNSPFFLGRQLWEETRIALMEEAADDRDVQRGERRDGRVTFGSDWVREGAYELFERYVRDYDPILPDLTDGAGHHDVPELRLHQGTIWQWNRPVYDPADGGHLRVEMRALPAGPSCADMTANTAFLLGLTLSQAERDLTGYRFAEAYQNFYRAAMNGLDATLSWPGEEGEFKATDLVLRLLPEAREGLLRAGVTPTDADRSLDVVEQRTRLRRTGSVWQREALERFRGDRRRMVRRYRELALSGMPVHLWP
ncbi:Gamma-glutamyl:cysteine ligase YbdK, ATP-grasp superfamily [Nonomuraea maritima]|uniref:Gamma-glutamyl:cysteine ligase YbdK, ATP-grasp superfamily n=1 Tax=Nonomuraea maritima TaxID=683260 RepID=A0A1G8Y569_9ACTN|nr:glutamate--cysteine ligase [Nonomuraea maritima]SDJ97220.1 Gamma-glutamyl:cysteine ligase YbdK, ATP-grasp superfamily [Nonomuraea maritima]